MSLLGKEKFSTLTTLLFFFTFSNTKPEVMNSNTDMPSNDYSCIYVTQVTQVEIVRKHEQRDSLPI